MVDKLGFHPMCGHGNGRVVLQHANQVCDLSAEFFEQQLTFDAVVDFTTLLLFWHPLDGVPSRPGLRDGRIG